MVVIQCKDGDLEVGDWVLHNILTRDFLAYSKKWIASHSVEQVSDELMDLASK